MSKKVQVTKPFNLNGSRFYAGNICTGKAAEFAVKQGFGKPAPAEKPKPPKNKSGTPKSNKGK